MVTVIITHFSDRPFVLLTYIPFTFNLLKWNVIWTFPLRFGLVVLILKSTNAINDFVLIFKFQITSDWWITLQPRLAPGTFMDALPVTRSLPVWSRSSLDRFIFLKVKWGQVQMFGVRLFIGEISSKKNRKLQNQKFWTEDNVSYVDSKKILRIEDQFRFSWNKYQFELFDWLDLGFRPLRLWTRSRNGNSIWTLDCLMNWLSYRARMAETNLHGDMASIWPFTSSIFIEFRNKLSMVRGNLMIF